MDKYIKLSQRSLLSLGNIMPGKLRTAHKSAQHSVSMEGMLADMMAIPSVSGDQEQLHLILNYVDTFLSERGMHMKRFEWNGVESLVASTRPTKTPKVMLMAHLDVVPAPQELYELKELNGNYLGRGAFDMKFAAAAYLQLIDEIQDDLRSYDLGVMFVTDEEEGGFNGAVKLIAKGYLPSVIVIPDGGDNWDIETFSKGLWHITISAEGKNAHGSRPWEGESATQKLMDAIHEIKQLFPAPDKTSSTLNIGVFNGGDVVNKVASNASASLDIRIASLKDDKKIRHHVRRICRERAITLTSEVYSPPVVNDARHPLLQSFMQSVTTVTGHTPREIMSFAATDGRHFAAVGVPCVVVRPPGGNLHGPNEWISKKGFFELKDVLRDYIDREAKSQN